MEDLSNVFLMQQRPFGEKWAQNYLLEHFKEFDDPRKYDKQYNGEYDLVMPLKNGKFIRIEVKAARMLKPKENDYQSLLDRAAKMSEIDEIEDFGFFQIKNYCTDVFILMTVFKDGIKYFVFSSKDIIDYDKYSDKQHRGNKGEGQIGIRKSDFKEFFSYEIDKKDLIKAVIDAYKRNF